MVQGMAAVGVPEDDIAKVLSVAPKTLRKHYRSELELAHIEANAKVSGSLFSIATSRDAEGKPLPGAVAAGIWWEKTRQGRCDPDRAARKEADEAAKAAAAAAAAAAPPEPVSNAEIARAVAAVLAETADEPALP